MDLRVGPVELKQTSQPDDWGAGIWVTANISRHGAEGVQVAQLLHEELKGQGADIQGGLLRDTITAFSVLVTNPSKPFCLPP